MFSSSSVCLSRFLAYRQPGGQTRNALAVQGNDVDDDVDDDDEGDDDCMMN